MISEDLMSWGLKNMLSVHKEHFINVYSVRTL